MPFMGKPSHIAWPAYSKSRKCRRFNLQYPLRLRFASDGGAAEAEAISLNVSTAGLLLRTASLIPRHTPVSLVMTIQGGVITRPIRIVGEGEIVRVEAREPSGTFAIAVQCRRPLSQLEEPLFASAS